MVVIMVLVMMVVMVVVVLMVVNRQTVVMMMMMMVVHQLRRMLAAKETIIAGLLPIVSTPQFHIMNSFPSIPFIMVFSNIKTVFLCRTCEPIDLVLHKSWAGILPSSETFCFGITWSIHPFPIIR